MQIPEVVSPIGIIHKPKMPESIRLAGVFPRPANCPQIPGKVGALHPVESPANPLNLPGFDEWFPVNPRVSKTQVPNPVKRYNLPEIFASLSVGGRILDLTGF